MPDTREYHCPYCPTICRANGRVVHECEHAILEIERGVLHIRFAPRARMPHRPSLPNVPHHSGKGAVGKHAGSPSEHHVSLAGDPVGAG